MLIERQGQTCCEEGRKEEGGPTELHLELTVPKLPVPEAGVCSRSERSNSSERILELQREGMQRARGVEK